MLSDCISKKPAETELFLAWSPKVSAALKAMRDRWTQAVLLLPGDLDPDDSLADLLDNPAMRALLSCICIGLSLPADMQETISPKFVNYDQLRYHKVTIIQHPGKAGKKLVDNLLTVIHRYQRPLMQEGHVFIIKEPLSSDCTPEEVFRKALDPETGCLVKVAYEKNGYVILDEPC